MRNNIRNNVKCEHILLIRIDLRKKLKLYIHWYNVYEFEYMIEIGHATLFRNGRKTYAINHIRMNIYTKLTIYKNNLLEFFEEWPTELGV